MRRSEKEITDSEIIRSVLIEGDICRLGLIDHGQAYIVPMNFGYEDNYIYFHSAGEGTKIDILKENPEVSFEIDIRHRIRENEKACSWSASYMSVMGSGRVDFILDQPGKVRALNVIMNKYSGRADWHYNDETVKKTTLFRLFIKEISCKESK